MKAVVHIGARRTGTSSLQWFFAHNRERLRASGFVYPEPLVGNAQHRLAWTFLSDAAGFGGQGLDGAELARLGDGIRSSRASNLLLSSEYFETFSPEVAAAFGDWLSSVGVTEWTAVLYVRRQDHAIESGLCQDMKFWHLARDEPFEVPSVPDRLPIEGQPQNYLEIARSWATAADSVEVVPFEPSLDADPVFGPMLRALGLGEREAWSMPPEHLNRRLGRAELEWMVRLPASVGAAVRERIVEILAAPTAGDGNVHRLFPPDARSRILAAYADANRGLAREFLGRDDGVLFRDVAVDLDDSWEPYALGVEDAVAIAARVVSSFSAER